MARVRGDVGHQALRLEVATGEESRLFDEGTEDGVRGDDPRRAPAHQLLHEPTVVVSVDVGQEHVQHICGGDPDLVEVGERFGRWIDEDALAVDPDDEARKVATGVEAVARSERRDPESRPVARELNGLAELGGDGPEEPRRRPHLEFLLARLAVRLGDANVESTPDGGRHPHLRRRQPDDGLLAVEREEVHVRVDTEEGAFRAAVMARGIQLMGGAQEVVRLARADAVRLGELLEGRRLSGRRVEEAEQREREQPIEDVPLPGGAGDARARLLAEEEVEVDEELDVGVIGSPLEQARGQDEQVVALESFAQDVLRGAGQAAELHAGGAVRAEQDGGVEQPNGASHFPQPLCEPGLSDSGAQGGHDGLVRLATNGQRGIPADQLLLGLRESVKDLVDEHERSRVGGVDQDADGSIAFGQDQRVAPRVAWRVGCYDPEEGVAVSIDADCPETEILERHVGELHPPPQLLQFRLSERATRQGGRQHVDDKRVDRRLDGLRGQPNPGERHPCLRRPRGHVREGGLRIVPAILPESVGVVKRGHGSSRKSLPRRTDRASLHVEESFQQDHAFHATQAGLPPWHYACWAVGPTRCADFHQKEDCHDDHRHHRSTQGRCGAGVGCRDARAARRGEEADGVGRRAASPARERGRCACHRGDLAQQARLGEVARGSRVRRDSGASRRPVAPGASAFLARGGGRRAPGWPIIVGKGHQQRPSARSGATLEQGVRSAGHREERRMRAIWTGSIAFGLVNIPVELHRAIRESRPHFRLLHAKDKSPVRFDRVCEREDRPVAWSEVVKGYEYTKGKFVVLTAEDLKRAALEKTRTFDILNFVPGRDIDDRFFETPYYAMPAKGGERAYVVLREALRQSEKTGVGKIMLRETQHLAALEAIGDALVLTMMRFPDELADLSDFRFPASGQQPKEVQMAKTLIDQLSAKWSPTEYKDEYQANLHRLIRAKLKGTT